MWRPNRPIRATPIRRARAPARAVPARPSPSTTRLWNWPTRKSNSRTPRYVRPPPSSFFFPSFLYLKQKKTRRSTPHTTTMAEETLQKKKRKKRNRPCSSSFWNTSAKKKYQALWNGIFKFHFLKNIRVIDDRMRSKQVELPISIFGLDVMEAPQKLKIVP